MLEVVVATRNRGKIGEIASYLKDENILIYSLNDFPSLTEVEEDGESFRENALKKARYVAESAGRLAVADDSGLEVDTLDGRPGVLSARFAGEKASDEDNNEKLLEEMKGLPPERRGASFRCVLALVEPSGEEVVIEEECRGTILAQKRGTMGFGYDPLFFFPPLDKTFAELTREEKNRVSHRGKALARLKEVLGKKARAVQPQ